MWRSSQEGGGGCGALISTPVCGLRTFQSTEFAVETNSTLLQKTLK
jgi:hypothetical protein